jgi:single-strand DNA-binding protein
MASGNNITLVGNITRDPELRFTPSGQATATFGLAVNRVWNDRQTNERKEAVSFFDIVCWREMAENTSESLQKGARVIVTGRLEQRSWENQEGEKRSKIEVVADEVGPSVRWAVAKPEKTDRRGPGQGGGSGSGGYSQQAYGGGSEGGGGAPQGGPGPFAPAGAPAAGGYDSDEEPF